MAATSQNPSFLPSAVVAQFFSQSPQKMIPVAVQSNCYDDLRFPVEAGASLSQICVTCLLQQLR
eukprot:7736594-Pyramimonas_sp.AAC.1